MNAVWLAVVGVLFASGASTVALVLGGHARCRLRPRDCHQHLCLPSETFAWLERRRARRDPITTRGEPA